MGCEGLSVEGRCGPPHRWCNRRVCHTEHFLKSCVSVFVVFFFCWIFLKVNQTFDFNNQWKQLYLRKVSFKLCRKKKQMVLLLCFICAGMLTQILSHLSWFRRPDVIILNHINFSVDIFSLQQKLQRLQMMSPVQFFFFFTLILPTILWIQALVAFSNPQYHSRVSLTEFHTVDEYSGHIFQHEIKNRRRSNRSPYCSCGVSYTGSRSWPCDVLAWRLQRIILAKNVVLVLWVLSRLPDTRMKPWRQVGDMLCFGYFFCFYVS